VLITNKEIDVETAQEINKIFFEVIISPSYQPEALNILKTKKNRIILKKKSYDFSPKVFKSVLNGVLFQDKDMKTETPDDMKCVTKKSPSGKEKVDLAFANIIVKHSKSNTIVLAKNKQLIASGVGQTSRVDSLKQAIEKANHFEKDLKGAVMSSDAFFPFPDNVEIAHKAGITAVVQPGGSIRDNESIKYCDENELSMVFTGIRHFRH
jgi:phosphoribosylaminoimidazolecarboxamide formyltransferase/IMP cyclohydrolase